MLENFNIMSWFSKIKIRLTTYANEFEKHRIKKKRLLFLLKRGDLKMIEIHPDGIDIKSTKKSRS